MLMVLEVLVCLILLLLPKIVLEVLEILEVLEVEKQLITKYFKLIKPYQCKLVRLYNLDVNLFINQL